MITVIDYGLNNLQSVCNALEKIGAQYRVIKRAEDLVGAKKVIFPGVGAAGAAMQSLRSSGFADAIQKLTVPVLGICLGMQLFADFSQENNTQCLSILSGTCVRFPSSVRTPQIGWNRVSFSASSPLIESIPSSSAFYFVHSYYLPIDCEGVIGQGMHGVPFAAIIQKGNFFGTQFHPERSGESGLMVLRNFCEKC